MNENEKPDQLRDRWVEALLRSASGQERAEVDTHVDQVMKLIAADSAKEGLAEKPASAMTARPGSQAPSGAGVSRRLTNRFSRLVPWSIAATVVLALALSYQGCSPDRIARAAISQSLAAASQAVPRHYRVVVQRRTAGGELRETANDLYVLGNDQVAWRHPLAGTRALWLGKSGDRAWVVPPFGPVLRGNGQAFGKWLDLTRAVDSPYLHVATILQRMERGYRLRDLPDSTVDGTAEAASNPVCRHVIGQRRWLASQDLPATIELWSDRTTGMARRIVLEWRPGSDRRNRERIDVVWVGEEPVSEDWFEAAGHHSGHRMVVGFDDRRALSLDFSDGAAEQESGGAEADE